MTPASHLFFRIDARSLGLFRILFGLTLIGDLLSRYKHIAAFYANEGVLPNHNHLFNLKQQGSLVWSALHAFSSADEARFGFFWILVFYLFFTLGLFTRVFHGVVLAALVSLAARNTLAAGPGDYLAISLCALTLFLPLGSRFSLDALRARVASARHAEGEDLNDRGSLPTAEQTQTLRLPGWSPVSIAAFGVILQLVLLMLALAAQQQGAWRSGTGLAKALQIDLFASPLGAEVAAGGLVGPLNHLLVLSQWAIPALLILPVLRHPLRLVAAVLLVVHGLTYGLLTNLGLFGYSVAASAALVIGSQSWDRWSQAKLAHARTIIYDADCGVCFFVCQLLRRMDTVGALRFVGNDVVGNTDGDAEVEIPIFDEKKRAFVSRKLPKEVTAELADKTVIVVRPDGTVATRATALAEVFRALPALGFVGLWMRLPLFHSIANWKYDVFAARRTAISGELGLASCGVTPSGEKAKPAPLAPLSPARGLRFRLTSGVREALALVFVLSLVAQTGKTNEIGFKAPESEFLAGVSHWTRTLADWRIMTPEPPTEQSRVVVDALTKGGANVDPLTGTLPTASFGAALTLGPMWSAYLTNIQKDEHKVFQAAFRTYIGKQGPLWPAEEPDDKIVGADAYLISGKAGAGPALDQKRMFRHGRGGNLLASAAPAIDPPPRARGEIPRFPPRILPGQRGEMAPQEAPDTDGGEAPPDPPPPLTQPESPGQAEPQ